MWMDIYLFIALLQIYCGICFERSFEIAQHLATLLWEKLIASSALCAWALSYWKMKNSLEIWRMADRKCCNNITLRLRLILLTNPDSMIVMYVSSWCNVNHFIATFVDWCHQLTERQLLCVQAFCHDAFLLGWWMCVQSVILRVSVWSLPISFCQSTKWVSLFRHYSSKITHEN